MDLVIIMKVEDITLANTMFHNDICFPHKGYRKKKSWKVVSSCCSRKQPEKGKVKKDRSRVEILNQIRIRKVILWCCQYGANISHLPDMNFGPTFA